MNTDLHIENQLLPRELGSTYSDLLERVHFHINITRRRSKLYHHLAYFVMWAPPILSAIVTAFAMKFTEAAFYISGLVTIVTVLNSTIRPYELMHFAERYSNRFCEFHTNLQLLIESTHLTKDDERSRKNSWASLLQAQNHQLSRMIEEFNNGPRIMAQQMSKK